MLLQSLSCSIAKPVLSLVLGGVILWQVAEHAGPTKGRVIIHAPTDKVEITVDNTPYWVESLAELPIVSDVAEGRRVARMLKEGRIVYQEEFTLERGKEVILTAWDGYNDGRSPQHDD